MALLTRSGKRLTGLKLQFCFTALLIAAASLSAQTPFTCATNFTNQVVHAEGVTEPVGVLLLNCSGGNAGQTVTTNLTATFPTNITNRVNSSGTPDISLTADTGSGPMQTGNPPVLQTANVLAINGVTFTIPATRAVTLRLTNVRLNMAVLRPNQLVIATIAETGISVNNATATIATPTTGLLANASTTAITCAGSPLPATLSIANLFAAGTRFTSLRFTEGFGNAFIAKDPTSDTGTRILIKYTGFPAGARIFIPDYIAGNSATQPTAAGDLGGLPSAGIYTPTPAGTLLLARVVGNDAVGAGGAPYGVASQFAGPTALGTVTEVPLVNGAANIAYEVIDANPSTQESAQFPTFLGLAANPQVSTANATLSLGPTTLVPIATAQDPIPRFLLTAPASDCQFLGDCNANYFPSLSVASTPLSFRSPSGGLIQTGYIMINNAGGGLLSFTTSIAYQTGSNFIFIDQNPGTANTTLRVSVSAAGLPPGIYQATITVLAGAAGSRTLPVTLTVDGVNVSVSAVTNAATLTPGPLVAGSLGTLMGTNLAGTNVTVTFDGISAPILFKSPTQINFQVPATIAGKTSSSVVVTVDGTASAAQTVTLAAAAPGIFGVLNQNGALNTSAVPVAPGSIVQIFLTGLSTAGFTVNANVDGFPNLIPLYAGDAPGIPGVQQVNVLLPVNVTTGPLKLQVCSNSLTLNACSPPVALAVR